MTVTIKVQTLERINDILKFLSLKLMNNFVVRIMQEHIPLDILPGPLEVKSSVT